MDGFETTGNGFGAYLEGGWDWRLAKGLFVGFTGTYHVSGDVDLSDRSVTLSGFSTSAGVGYAWR